MLSEEVEVHRYMLELVRQRMVSTGESVKEALLGTIEEVNEELEDLGVVVELLHEPDPVLHFRDVGKGEK